MTSKLVLVIDNYDSFTYNLVQYLQELGAATEVVRNDAVSVDEIRDRGPAAIVISPGPRTPGDAGVCLDVVRQLGPATPILGVCLGHQAIGEGMGGRVVRAPTVMHGKVSAIHHDGKGCLRGLDNPFDATRYHSLIVDRDGLPECLEVSAWTGDGVIMGVRHRELPVEGVQFHPESFCTPSGRALLGNFLAGSGIAVAEYAPP